MLADVVPARTVRVHEKDLLTAVERRDDHVTPQELASWIVEGRSDYRLVDVRDAKAYAEYHIPTAENVPLATVADGALGRTDNLVLYGDGGIHAAQAWMVLKGRGFTSVRTLLEGLDAWKDEVLFPVQPRNASAEGQARFERAVAPRPVLRRPAARGRGAGQRARAEDDDGRAGDAVRGSADAAGRRRRAGPPQEEGRLLSRSVAQVHGHGVSQR